MRAFITGRDNLYVTGSSHEEVNAATRVFNYCRQPSCC